MAQNQNPEFEIMKFLLIQALNDLMEYPRDNMKFKKGDFIELKVAMNKKFATTCKTGEKPKTISWQLLRNMISYKYDVPVPTHPKIIKSLDKVAFYLENVTWTEFSKNIAINEVTLYVEHYIQFFIQQIDLYLQGKLINASNIASGKMLKNLINTKVYDVNVREIAVSDIFVLKVTDKFAFSVVTEWRFKHRRTDAEDSSDGKKIRCIYVLKYENSRWFLDERFILQEEQSILID